MLIKFLDPKPKTDNKKAQFWVRGVISGSVTHLSDTEGISITQAKPKQVETIAERVVRLRGEVAELKIRLATKEAELRRAEAERALL